MVAVRDKKIIASLVTLALVAGPAGLGAAVTEETTDPVEPDCYPADDGTGAYVCEFPDTCEPDLSGTCSAPDECERVDDRTVRCAPPENETSSADADPNETLRAILIRSSGEVDASGQALAECRLDPETDELVCRPAGECREQPELDHCRPPAACEPAENGTYRCQPTRGSGPPGHAQNRSETEPAPGSGGPGENDSHEGPDCRLGESRGTLICEPPAACEGKIGQTEACTPPPECQALGDGTFRCEVPDREAPERGDDGEANGSGSAADDSPFRNRDPKARAEARAAIADSIREEAQAFGSEISSMREEYRAQVDELRAEYADGKAQLRAEYQDCRDAIPEDANASERNAQLRACVETARSDLAQLRNDLQERHEQIRQTFKQRAEQAREEACQRAENAALDAVAKRGLFDANPGALMPDRALEMCPSLGDFDDGGEPQ